MPNPPNPKRDRKRQNAAAARAAQLEAARQAKKRQTLIRTGVLGAFILGVAVLMAFLSSRDDGKKVSAGSSKDKTSTTLGPTTTTVNAAALAAITCDDRKPEANTKRPTFDKPPDMTVDPTKKYTATLDTSCGKITADLDVKTAPKTVNNFVFLARKGFYDGLTWHRVSKDFVIQGGDPKGTGSGGPGYQFGDELPSDGYKLGSLAMANSGPDTNGSQFFIVTGSNGTALPNSYSRFGQATEGLGVAQKMESFVPAPDAQDRQDGPPTRPLYIFKVEITESAP
jgi:cyclophilin family peptidyl-prolyl cis-trans isomerase